MIILDAWQKEILEAKGNIVLCSGRQVGKSTIIARKAGNFALQNRNKSILIISCTERQAEELFLKVLNYIEEIEPRIIKKGRDRPTRHILRLNNGSIIRSLPTGIAGTGIRGFTIDMLIVDEAAFVPDEVFPAVLPMLLTTGGDIILVSTPHGKIGFFYRCYCDTNFKIFHVNSEKVIRERPVSVSWSEIQRDKALGFLESQKKQMSALQYAQEYMGQFIDSFSQFFSDELIKNCMVLKRRNGIYANTNHYLGVDVARLGEDLGTFEIIDGTDKENLKQVESIITTKTRINETYTKILDLDKKYKFKRIYIDDGGIGVGVFDFLLENPQTRKKIIAINNRARPLDREESHKKKLLKEDLYNNLLMLMETGRLKLLNDDEVFNSLKSIQYEYLLKTGMQTSLRIFGSNAHVCEGLMRAAWCIKDKSLNIWCAYSNHGKIYNN